MIFTCSVNKTNLLVLFATVFFMEKVASQSLPIPPPSPRQTITQQFATGNIEIDYSRPGVKGRKAFGDVVPYGKVWRTGANAATTITFTDDVIINSVKVDKGKYGLLTIPNEDEWIIIITRDVNVTSPNQYKPENDVVRVNARPNSLCYTVETFTIDINNIKPTEADIFLRWDRTEVSFKIKAEIDEKIMAAIEKEMSTDKRPYYQAANYYYENGKDLNKALEWINKAIEMRPDAYWMMHTKAKILYKLKDYHNAVAIAEASLAKAKEAGADDYIKFNEKLIAEIKSQPDYKPAAPKKK
jgi:hypothetical protein